MMWIGIGLVVIVAIIVAVWLWLRFRVAPRALGSLSKERAEAEKRTSRGER